MPIHYDALTAGLLSQIDFYVKSASSRVRFAKSAQAENRAVKDIWFDPVSSFAVVRRFGDGIIEGSKTASVSADKAIPPEWCGLALSVAERPNYFKEARGLVDRILCGPKTADSPTLFEKLKSIAGFDNRYYETNPVAAMLASGVLGAGAGYGGASLASLFLPKEWDKKHFRRMGALYGAGIGAAPGALNALGSLLIGQPLLDGTHMKLENKGKLYNPKANEPAVKENSYDPFANTAVDTDFYVNMLWNHPVVSNQLTPPQKSVATAAMSAAQSVAHSPFVTPADMGRLTAGMGSGYASGLVAGKVLSALTGMPKSYQNTLANAGMYGGIAKAVTSMIFNPAG